MTPNEVAAMITDIRRNATAQEYVTDEAQLLDEIRAILVVILGILTQDER